MLFHVKYFKFSFRGIFCEEDNSQTEESYINGKSLMILLKVT